ncbi:MAG: hypothetical protein ACREA0_01925 [bacterium]
MTGEARNYRNELDRVADAMIEDILATPDEEIIAEAREDYGDPGRVADEVRGVYERARLVVGKGKLQAAKAAIASARTSYSHGPLGIVDIVSARHFIARIAVNDPDIDQRITLAARNLDDLSDDDVIRIINDLRELGAFQEGDNL